MSNTSPGARSLISPPHIVEVPAQPVACISLRVLRQEIKTVMGPGIQEIFRVITEQGLKPTGAWFTHHRERPSTHFDFSICVPIAAPVTPSGRVECGTREAATVARTLYRGGYEGLGAAWGEFHAWIAAKGHAPRRDLWECYLQGPESGADPAQWQTELNQPLTARAM